MSTGTDTVSGLSEWLASGPDAPASPRAESPDPIAEAREDRLIARSQEGSHEAFRELVEMHQDRLFRFCLSWVRDAGDAEEICQDTFVRAFHALPRYRKKRAGFAAWLFRIALNLARDRSRSRRRRLALRTDPLDHSAHGSVTCPGARPDESCENEERLRALREGIDALPRRLREVILLCAVEGLSYDECSEVLDCSVRAIEGRLYRGRRRLLEWCEAREKKGVNSQLRHHRNAG